MNTCKTCSAACRTSVKTLECRAQPPVSTPVVGPNQLGQPHVIATIATFPIVQPDWWCRGWEKGEAQQQSKPFDAMPMLGKGLSS